MPNLTRRRAAGTCEGAQHTTFISLCAGTCAVETEELLNEAFRTSIITCGQGMHIVLGKGHLASNHMQEALGQYLSVRKTN